MKSDKFTLKQNVMLTHKELINVKDWYFTCGTSDYDWYRVGDAYNESTNERGVGVSVDFAVVGKDELDALYRIQRIIEDKIHEARTRPQEIKEVNIEADEECSNLPDFLDGPFA